MFAYAYEPNQPVIQQCFPLITNQQTILSAMAYQPSEHGEVSYFLSIACYFFFFSPSLPL
jgi:hypothetical protein